MRWPKYERYKASGVEWLPEIPDGWALERLKTAADCWVSSVDKIATEGEIPVRLCNYTDVYYHDEIRLDMEFMEATASPEEILRFKLATGDVVITKDSEDWRDIAVPAVVAESASDLVCGYHLAIVRPDPARLDGRFLLRAFQSAAMNQQFQVAASGVTRYGLPKSSIGDAWAPLPPPDEQRTIASFLDRETARIDALVEKKRALIEKLAEKRSALISRTVTRGLPPDAARAAGLDPHPKLKASGVEWLGEVPEHWEVRRLKFVSPQITVGVVVEPSKYYEDEGVPCLRSLNVKPNQLIAEDLVRISDASNDLLSKSKLREGDLVAVRSGQPGTTAVVDGRFDGANCIDLILIRRPPRADGRFLAYFLNSQPAQVQFAEGAGGAIQQHFNIATAADLLVALPPLPEQRAIASYLDRETAKIDALVAKVEAAIDRLQEYRAALITAAVTGKIDVRGATGAAPSAA